MRWLIPECKGRIVFDLFHWSSEVYPAALAGCSSYLCCSCMDALYPSDVPWEVLRAVMLLGKSGIFARLDSRSNLEEMRLKDLFCDRDGCPHGGHFILGEMNFCLEHSVEEVYKQSSVMFGDNVVVYRAMIKAWLDRSAEEVLEVLPTSHHHAPREGGEEAAVAAVVKSLRADSGWMAWASRAFAEKHQAWLDAGSPVEHVTLKISVEKAAMRLDEFMTM
tara:strand:+ start:887 stop:1546 length:660 start_codon:yes stop_codon:yes gene_type:complete